MEVAGFCFYHPNGSSAADYFSTAAIAPHYHRRFRGKTASEYASDLTTDVADASCGEQAGTVVTTRSVRYGGGTNFERCGSHSLLYVGQSMGALGERLNLGLNQAENAERTRSWMENWRVNNPRSSFWQVADNLGRPKELAWSNIVKIDVPAAQNSRRGKPPQQRYWQTIAGYLIDALAEEIDQLRPRVTLFVTGAYCREIVETALETCGYFHCVADEVGKVAIDAQVWRSAENRWAVRVRHPQGTTSEWRDSLAELVYRLRC